MGVELGPSAARCIHNGRILGRWEIFWITEATSARREDTVLVLSRSGEQTRDIDISTEYQSFSGT